LDITSRFPFPCSIWEGVWDSGDVIVSPTPKIIGNIRPEFGDGNINIFDMMWQCM
jgi:hypothetical protein